MGKLAPGTEIAERYRLDRPLGEGGMGEVWGATHLVTRKAVALKILKPASAAKPDMVRRFIREARAASAVRHPNVVNIHDVIETDEAPVMVMDLLEGESMAELLDRQHTILLPDLARIMVPVISAVGTAHARGIVHRDLKPENIFLAERGDGTVEPKVLDFGIAKLLAVEGEAAATTALTETGSMLGTPFYMAPEQVFGERDIDFRVDVWALGVILFESLTGDRPFRGDNFGQVLKAIAMTEAPTLHDVAPHVPEDVARLVSRMLCKDRAQRCSDLRDVLQLLGEYTETDARVFSAPRSHLVSVDYEQNDIPTIGPMSTPVISESAAIRAMAATIDAEPVPPRPSSAPTMQATRQERLEAHTQSPLSRTLASSRPPPPAKSRRPVAAVVAVAVVGVVGLVWGLWPTREGAPASSLASPPGVASAPVAPAVPPSVEATAAPAEASSAAPSAEVEAEPAPVRRAKSRDAATRPAKVKAEAPAEKPTKQPPSKLPGGILDQDEAPF